MTNPPKPIDMPQEFYERCLDVTKRRAKVFVHHILKHGYISTEELKDEYGYDHPPRAARDVRENGIPLKTERITSEKTGRRIGIYKFDYSKPVRGRIGGRSAFSASFKKELVNRYGSRCALNNEVLHPRYLQIDHRVPYEVAGNEADENVENFMLLDASGQRAKSWSCEHCDNFKGQKDPNICEGCFWARPEKYTHIAMKPERRMDILWQEQECREYDSLVTWASRHSVSPQDVIKSLVKDYLDKF